MHRAAIELVAMLAVTLTAASSAAKTTIVTWGPGTPLQDAINAAAPGDTLILDGVFHEAIVVDRPLRLLGPSAIDGGCGPAKTIEVTADGVQMRRLVVYGGSVATIDIQNRADVRLVRVSVASQPFAGGCPDAQYGAYISNSTDVKLSRFESIRSGPGNRYQNAFIHVGGIPADGNVRVRRSFSNYENQVGILVENSADTAGYPNGVVLRGNAIVSLSSATGILLRNSEGVQVTGNRVSTYTGIGIDVDATSQGNFLIRNRLELNPLDVRDLGTNNCWKGNTFDTGTVPPCP